MNSAATTSSGRRRRKNQYVSVNLRSPSEGEDSPDRSTTIRDDEDDEDEDEGEEEEKAGNDTGGDSEGSCDESFDDEYSFDDETITIPPLPSQSQSQSQSQSRLNPIHIPCQIPGRERADYYAETSAIRDDMDENNININIINNNNNNNNNNIFNDIDNNVIETGNRIGTNSSNHHHHQRIIHNHNHNHNSNNTGAMEIDPDAVRELTDDLHDLRVNLMFLLLIFAVMAGGLALNDLYYLRRPGANTTTKAASTDGNGHGNAIRDDGTGMGNNNSNNNNNSNRPPFPHRGHKIQINASAFTANDFECLQLDTGNWPSERVHCELLPNDGSDDDNHNNNNNYNYNYNNNNDDDVARYSFVVEHFDDDACTVPNAQNPVVRHTASGCYYYETYNHSYHDLCHPNRTLTVSAFEGPGCLLPLPVTATNLLPED